MAPADAEALAARPNESLETFAAEVLRLALGFLQPPPGAMAPFLLMQKPEGNTVESFAMMPPAEGIPLARKRAAAQPAEVARIALAYDGYVSVENQKKKDALLIECHERGQKYGFVFAQCYEWGADGKPVPLGECQISPGRPFLSSPGA